MKLLFSVLLLIFSSAVFAAPLRSGFSSAPLASASPEERERAFLEARNSVIAAALKYEGVPYRHGGIASSGMDCSGFVFASFRDALSISVPRTSSGLYSWTEIIPLEKAQPGDLLFFKTDHSGRITHVGLYLGDRRFIHSASAGPNTGVIFSTLDERYWGRTYAAAGRAFPEVQSGYRPVLASAAPGAASGTSSAATGAGSSGTANNAANVNTGSVAVSPRPGVSPTPPAAAASDTGAGRLLLGVGIAPTLSFMEGGSLFRGVASHFRVSVETKMAYGLEIRPEYDNALGVFRIPIVFSLGPSDKFYFFAGPVFSFGDAAIKTENGERNYKGGTSWMGAVGVTVAPFAFNVGNGKLSPYAEAAWQHYLRDNEAKQFKTDFWAGFRFSTGIRWAIQVR